MYSKEQRKAIAQAARDAANTARREVFHVRAKDMGGYTAKTRAQIDSECDQAAREAARNTYLAWGYEPCPVMLAADPSVKCDRLVGPGFPNCGNHAGNEAVNPESTECSRCAGTGKFITGYVNGQPVGPGGPCYRCAGKGRITKRDLARNWGYDNFYRRIEA